MNTDGAHGNVKQGFAHPKLSQPLLTVVRFLLAKREIDELALPVLRRAERDHVFRHVREVVPGVRILARSETLKGAKLTKSTQGLNWQMADLVVLRVPLVRIWSLFEPLLILGDGEEIDPLLALCDLCKHVGVTLRRRKIPVTYSNDGCHELNQEIRNLQQRRKEMVQEIDEESLDVRAVVILCARGQRFASDRVDAVTDLIGHDHELSVS